MKKKTIEKKTQAQSSLLFLLLFFSMKSKGTHSPHQSSSTILIHPEQKKRSIKQIKNLTPKLKKKMKMSCYHYDDQIELNKQT